MASSSSLDQYFTSLRSSKSAGELVLVADHAAAATGMLLEGGHHHPNTHHLFQNATFPSAYPNNDNNNSKTGRSGILVGDRSAAPPLPQRFPTRNSSLEHGSQLPTLSITRPQSFSSPHMNNNSPINIIVDDDGDENMEDAPPAPSSSSVLLPGGMVHAPNRNRFYDDVDHHHSRRSGSHHSSVLLVGNNSATTARPLLSSSSTTATTSTLPLVVLPPIHAKGGVAYPGGLGQKILPPKFPLRQVSHETEDR